MKLILLLVLPIVGCASKPYKPMWDTSQSPVCFIKQNDRNMIAKCNGLKLNEIFKEPKEMEL